MKITCLALEPGGGMRPVAEAAAIAGWRAGGGPCWIDIRADRPEEVVAWLAGLGLDPGLVELMQVGEDETRILPLADSVFVAYPVPAGEGAWKPAHFSCLCLERLVITMHAEDVGALVLDESVIARLKLAEATTAGVVCALAILHTSRLRRQVVTLRKAGDVLVDRMDADAESVPLGEILGLKRQVLALGGVVDEELAVLEVLKASKRPALPLHRIGETFQIAIELARATDRDIDRLDGRLGDLQLRCEAVQHDRTNRRLAQLTVLSAFFMPLTLVAGIYGMNFDFMPELHFRYGYPMALGGMALITGGIFWYFKSRWWQR
jgi:magnesium transporter